MSVSLAILLLKRHPPPFLSYWTSVVALPTTAQNLSTKSSAFQFDRFIPLTWLHITILVKIYTILNSDFFPVSPDLWGIHFCFPCCSILCLYISCLSLKRQVECHFPEVIKTRVVILKEVLQVSPGNLLEMKILYPSQTWFSKHPFTCQTKMLYTMQFTCAEV